MRTIRFTLTSSQGNRSGEVKDNRNFFTGMFLAPATWAPLHQRLGNVSAQRCIWKRTLQFPKGCPLPRSDRTTAVGQERGGIYDDMLFDLAMNRYQLTCERLGTAVKGLSRLASAFCTVGKESGEMIEDGVFPSLFFPKGMNRIIYETQLKPTMTDKLHNWSLSLTTNLLC